MYDITAITDGDTNTAAEIMKRNRRVPTTGLDHDSEISNRDPIALPDANFGDWRNPAPGTD